MQPDIIICEAVLDADVGDQLTGYQQRYRSEIIDSVFGECAEGGILRNWGTPVVNASSTGNYYAYSDSQTGIMCGFKRPNERFFRVAFNGPEAKDVVRVDPGTNSLHPSFNSYSRLHLGEPDAALVWQEGHDIAECGHGSRIYYTRLFGDAAQLTLVHGLTELQNPQLDLTLSDPNLVLVDNFRVMLLSDFNNGIFDHNERPTLYRILNDYDQVLRPAPWYIPGIVNQKADRVMWQSRPQEQWPLQVQNTVQRRSFDVRDYWARTTTQTTGVLSGQQAGIFSTTLDLRSPNLSQGELATDLYSAPLSARDWSYEDTVMSLTFESYDGPAVGVDGNPMLLSFGYDLYGTNVNYNLANLQAGQLSIARAMQIPNEGRHPTLAARYSTFQHPGVQKNRLIYEEDEGNVEFTDPPRIARSTEGLYKEGDVVFAKEILTRGYFGFRSVEGEALLSDIQWGSTESKYRFDNTDKEKKDNSVIETSWITPQQFSELNLAVISSGKTEAFDAFIERRSDGLELNLNVLANNLGRAPRSQKWNVQADTNDQYRIVVRSNDKRASFANDVELYSMAASLEKPSAAQWLDLRTMRHLTTSTALQVLPQPATDIVTLCLTSGNSEVGAVQYEVYSVNGENMISTQSSQQRVIELDVTALSKGAYLIVARNSLREILASSAMVIAR